MTVLFQDKEIQNLYVAGSSGNKLYKKLSRQKTFMRDFIKVMQILFSVSDVDELRKYGVLNYEKLKHDLGGKSSVRIGYCTKYRLIFTESEDKITITLLEINEHYGDK